MVASTENENAREAGARLACLIAFRCSDAHSLRDECLCGDVSLRKGAAAVYARNAADHQVGEECQQRLRRFFDDEDPEVRTEAASFLRHLSADDLRELGDLVREWSRSRSLDDGADAAAYMLQDHATANPALTLDLAARMVEMLGQEMADIRTRHGGMAHYLTPAILNVYHRSVDETHRSRAIDLFEALEELGCPEVNEALEVADRM